MPNKLPQGWVECKLKDFASVKGGKRLPAGAKYSEDETKFPYIRVTNFDNMSVNLYDIKYLTQEIQQKIKNYTISKEDVYISIAGSIGKAGTIPSVLDGANLTENAAKIVHKINKDYLSYILNSDEVQHQIALSTKSTTQPKLALYRIEALKIKLPPLNEQKRIVEKIEEEFGKIDKGVEKLKLAQEQIKQYRQSVLKSAFEGKLYKTTEWEEKTLGQVIFPRRERITPNNNNGEIPFIGMDCIKPNSLTIHEQYKLKDTKSVSFVFYENDVLYGRMRSYLNKVWQATFAGAASAEFIVFPENENIEAGFLKYLLHQQNFVKYATRNASGDRPRVKFESDLADYKFICPSKDEQKQIVAEIEKRFEVADEAERVITENLDKAEQLKQSILKKAFEGRLVSQAPTDQPASELLAKIQAERGDK